ncbi:DoxX family protein [Mycolicibacterium sp.]|uniref:DoxX family protein n=1 Tax=Mycolicibacterium sp. TaxID=2320850 RepID=UPI003D125689
MTADPALPKPASGIADTGLVILRVGLAAAILQGGIIKASDFSTTVGYMAEGGWRLPALAAFMVTATEVLGSIGLLLGALTPLAACGVLSAMACAWAVNVSGEAVWSNPFNVPFLLALGAATLLFTGAGSYSVDRRLLRRVNWPKPLVLGLLVVAFGAAVLTWVALYGVNPIHFSTPAGAPAH